jgi:HAD superfamily hydrolase (TIGR01509 family)
MHLETILFDVDGTLVDSNELHARCWIEAFEHFGKRFDYDLVFSQMGKGGDLLVPDLTNAREMQRFGEELQEYRGKLFKEKYLPRVKPFPYAKPAMQELARRGVTLALASSSNEDEVEYHTRLLGVEDLLEGKTSKGDAELSKPSPEIFRAALERVGGDPRKTLVVGDTPYDVLAAHRAALPVVAVLSGGFPRETLTKAEFLFADVEEMVRKIDEVDAYFEHE